MRVKESGGIGNGVVTKAGDGRERQDGGAGGGGGGGSWGKYRGGWRKNGISGRLSMGGGEVCEQRKEEEEKKGGAERTDRARRRHGLRV